MNMTSSSSFYLTEDYKPWRITYKHGLMNTIVVYARSFEEAKRIGTAEYRRNSGFVENVLFRSIDDTIASAELCAL